MHDGGNISAWAYYTQGWWGSMGTVDDTLFLIHHDQNIQNQATQEEWNQNKNQKNPRLTGISV
jgi:hypothetical protein